MSVLLKVEKLEVTYHRVVTAVQGVSLEVPRGSIVVLIGNKGAGKTTTLRAISGFLGLDDAQITEGSVTFAGERIDSLPPHRIARRGVALVPEQAKVFDNLSVEENLLVPAAMRPALPIEAVFEHFPALARLRHREAGYLSGGERQMLAIGAALRCGPELLLIDELSLGLAPLVVNRLLAALRAAADDQGVAVLLVEQNAQVALDLADHGYVMENGRVVLDGSPQRLRSHEDVREFYLGSGSSGRRSYRDVKQYRRSRRWYG